MIFKSGIRENMRFVVCFVVIVFLASASGKTIRKVVYQEGPVEEDSSTLEEIPPREEWFMVKGDHPELNHLPRSQQIAQGETQVFTLPTNVKQAVVGNAVGSSQRNNQEDGEVVIAREEERRGNARMINVNVRNRGRIGFQRDDEERRQVFARRGGEGEDWEEFTKAPPLSGRNRNKGGQQNEQNWHLHIRHEGGHHDRNRGKTEISQRPQQPREPDDEVEMVDEGVERVRETGATQTSRLEPKDEDYEYDAVSTTRNANPANGRHVEALAIREYDSSDQRHIVSLKSSRNKNNHLLSENDYEEEYSNSPPPHDQVARMARYIVRNSNWTSIATISTMDPVRGFPFVNIVSISDGPSNNSSGIPYMYLTPLDMSAMDLRNDPRASLTMSLAQSDYCRQQQYDPEDPRCAKVILSGRIAPVTNKAELQYARNAVYSRHPDMQSWPKDHDWFFAKINIAHVVVLDYFGGAKIVALDDYFNVPSL